jgi:hypothetical protein
VLPELDVRRLDQHRRDLGWPPAAGQYQVERTSQEQLSPQATRGARPGPALDSPGLRTSSFNNRTEPSSA